MLDYKQRALRKISEILESLKEGDYDADDLSEQVKDLKYLINELENQKNGIDDDSKERYDKFILILEDSFEVANTLDRKISGVVYYNTGDFEKSLKSFFDKWIKKGD